MAAQDTRRGHRNALKSRLMVWLVGSAAGVLLLALPDDDDRVFSLSDTHGPSLIDLVGMVVSIGAWVPIAAFMWSRRSVLADVERRLVTVAFAVAIVLLGVTVGLDLGAWWLAAVALLLGPQLYLLYVVWSRA